MNKLGITLLLAGGLAALPARAQVVYAAGDIAYCSHPDARWSGAAVTADLLAARLQHEPEAVVLTLGDNVYPRGTLTEYQRCYAPTWGRFKERTWPVPGNRD